MQDTLDVLKIQTSLPVGDFGAIFWAKSYCSKSGTPDSWNNFAEFMQFCSEGWEQHYDLPYSGVFGLTLRLNQPLRKEGFESVCIECDYLLGQVSSEFILNGDEVSKDKLAFPDRIIICLKDLLIEFGGELLFCHYCNLPNEGDPAEVEIQFMYCRKITMETDQLLTYIASRLSQALGAYN